MGEEGKPVTDIVERVSHVMLRVVSYVMWAAPFAVFAAMTSRPQPCACKQKHRQQHGEPEQDAAKRSMVARAVRMIPKSGNRFSDRIMRHF